MSDENFAEYKGLPILSLGAMNLLSAIIRQLCSEITDDPSDIDRLRAMCDDLISSHRYDSLTSEDFDAISSSVLPGQIPMPNDLVSMQGQYGTQTSEEYLSREGDQDDIELMKERSEAVSLQPVGLDKERPSRQTCEKCFCLSPEHLSQVRISEEPSTSAAVHHDATSNFLEFSVPDRDETVPPAVLDGEKYGHSENLASWKQNGKQEHENVLGLLLKFLAKRLPKDAIESGVSIPHGSHQDEFVPSDEEIEGDATMLAVIQAREKLLNLLRRLRTTQKQDFESQESTPLESDQDVFVPSVLVESEEAKTVPVLPVLIDERNDSGSKTIALIQEQGEVPDLLRMIRTARKLNVASEEPMSHEIHQNCPDFSPSVPTEKITPEGSEKVPKLPALIDDKSDSEWTMPVTKRIHEKVSDSFGKILATRKQDVAYGEPMPHESHQNTVEFVPSVPTEKISPEGDEALKLLDEECDGESTMPVVKQINEN